MTLTVHGDARREIQQDVDALVSSPKYFNIKVERAKTYFPIIEKIFKEEGVPDDLKYLVIQESALISDAVSTSNAVGFWQFKAETAREMGLKIDKRVDERMNIVAASKGAAKYFKQSNSYFNNWLLVVQSYQMGIGGTMRSEGEEHSGSRHMDVTSNTYWYVKKYLAHKVAFEDAFGGGKGQVVVTPVLASGISLDEIAQKSGVDVEKLKDYNKWIKNGAVPDDKDYMVVIPKGDLNDFNTLWLTSGKKSTTSSSITTSLKEIELNGLHALTAQKGETITGMAKRAHVDLSDFIRWNDASVDWPVSPGQVYYLQRKIKASNQSTYTTKANENLWDVSQTFGIRLKTLTRLNDHLTSNQLKPGTVIYLADKPGKINPTENQMVELDPASPFEWGISGKCELDYVINASQTDALNETKVGEMPPVELTKKIIANQHTVSPGETLYSIAHQHGLQVVDLQRLNNLTNDATLQPGQVLKLADFEPVKSDLSVHEVKPSDTIYSIARQYGLSVKELMNLNNKTDFDLKPGQKLIIK